MYNFLDIKSLIIVMQMRFPFTMLVVLICIATPTHSAISWSEEITAGSTQIKASHINELRAQIEALEAASGKWGDVTGGINYAGGNVGIGTTSPNKKLQVEGAIKSGSGGATSGMTMLESRYATTDSPNILGSHYSSAATVLGYAVRPKSGQSGYISSADNASWRRGVLEMTDQLRFLNAGSQTTAEGADVSLTERFRIASDGNVGIGAILPTQKLHVDGQILVDVNNAASESDISFSSNAVIGGGTNSLSVVMPGSAYYRVMTGGTGVTGTSNTGGWAGATERLRVTAAGNVGIGDTSPNAKLEVNGQISGGFGAMTTSGTTDWNHVSNARSGNGYSLLLGTATNGPGGGSYYHPFGFEYNGKAGSGNMTQFAMPYSIGANASPYLRTRYSGTWSAWSKILSENTSGNVGIGTVAPTTKLDVQGAHSTTKARLYSVGNGAALDASLDLWASEPGVAYDGSGIGNNVNGHPYYGKRRTTLGQSYLRFQGGNVMLSTSTTSANATEKMRILGNGNVGIGTASPAYKIDVAGNGRMSGDLLFSNYGVGPVGTYSATRYQNVFSMGAAYTPADDGTALNNMYGIAWTHSNVGGESIPGLSHQALFVTAGDTRAAIGTGIWTKYDVTGNRFMDQNSTAYYADPNAESRFNQLRMSGNLRRAAHNVGHLEGSYNNVGNNQNQSNPIYTIGSNYNPAASTLSNMYGIGYTNGSASFIQGNGSGWGMYVASDGDARTFLSGSSSGNSYIGAGGGNLGIGTASPSQKLHVAGDTLLAGRAYIGSTDSYFYRDAANRIATPDNFYVQASSPATYLYSTNTYLGNTSGDNIHLRGNRLTWNTGTLTTAGNMGINETNPNARLVWTNSANAAINCSGALNINGSTETCQSAGSSVVANLEKGLYVKDTVKAGMFCDTSNNCTDIQSVLGVTSGSWGTWTNVTSSRVKKTWYTNTTGKGKSVHVHTNYGAPTVYVSPTASSSNWVQVAGPDGDSGEWGPAFFIVPPGHSYYINTNNSMRYVSELTMPL